MHLVCGVLKLGNSRTLISLYSSFQLVESKSKMFCLDLNCRSLVSEATTLPDVPQLSTAPVSDVGIQTHNSLHHVLS